MMIKKKGLLVVLSLLLFIFLTLSFVKSSVHVPTTRSLKSNPGIRRSSYVDQDEFIMSEGGGKMSEDEEKMMISVEGRMEIERMDYPGTGANSHHDPRNPGGRP
ncbi:hypothetical protein LINPERPRIM_LOCUS31036 [Linum perenne]